MFWKLGRWGPLVASHVMVFLAGVVLEEGLWKASLSLVGLAVLSFGLWLLGRRGER